MTTSSRARRSPTPSSSSRPTTPSMRCRKVSPGRHPPVRRERVSAPPAAPARSWRSPGNFSSVGGRRCLTRKREGWRAAAAPCRAGAAGLGGRSRGGAGGAGGSVSLPSPQDPLLSVAEGEKPGRAGQRSGSARWGAPEGPGGRRRGLPPLGSRGRCFPMQELPAGGRGEVGVAESPAENLPEFTRSDK